MTTLISNLTHKEKSDYFVDCLSMMYDVEDTHHLIDALDHQQWGTSNGRYFKQIEILDVVQQQQAREVQGKKELLFTRINDVASILVFMNKTASGVDADISNDL
jgi:hypothetical protein